jgi:hypothetical protein
MAVLMAKCLVFTSRHGGVSSHHNATSQQHYQEEDEQFWENFVEVEENCDDWLQSRLGKKRLKQAISVRKRLLERAVSDLEEKKTVVDEAVITVSTTVDTTSCCWCCCDWLLLLPLY